MTLYQYWYSHVQILYRWPPLTSAKRSRVWFYWILLCGLLFIIEWYWYRFRRSREFDWKWTVETTWFLVYWTWFTIWYRRNNWYSTIWYGLIKSLIKFQQVDLLKCKSGRCNERQLWTSTLNECFYTCHLPVYQVVDLMIIKSFPEMI